MGRLKDKIQCQALWGEPIQVDGVTITPQSQALSVRWPRGGWVWNRPIAVLVEGQGGGGEAGRIPIIDVTRVAQWAMWGVTIALSVLTVGLFLAQYVRERRDGHG